jgi:hypothetical protein
VEQFVPHGGVVYKVFVLGEQVWVGERKSLPDIGAPSPEALMGLAAAADGTVRAAGEGEEASVGYVSFDSSILTKGKQGSLVGSLRPATRLADHPLDSGLISCLRENIAQVRSPNPPA